MPPLNEVFEGLVRWLNVTYTIFDLALIALANMYLAHVITSTDGPFNIFSKLREKTQRVLGGMLDCVVCTAPWTALALFLLYSIAPALIWVFAIAGIALAIRAYTGFKHG